MWPVIMEWKSRNWQKSQKLTVENEIIDNLSRDKVVIFWPERLPPVFRDIDDEDFGSVSHAIESLTGSYDYDEEEIEFPAF